MDLNGSSPAKSKTLNNLDTIDPHAALVEFVQQHPAHPSSDGTTTCDGKENHEYRQEALAYLLNYETMVRQQEAEDMAVLAHIRPCVTRLLQIIHHSNIKPPRCSKDGDDAQPLLPSAAIASVHHSHDFRFLTQEVSMSQLRYAVHEMDRRHQQQSNCSGGDGDPEHYRRGMVEFMTTDRQLMMVLRLLSSLHEDDDTDDCNAAAIGQTGKADVTLTWAEIIQCYKICISGMVTLQHLANEKSGVSEGAMAVVRARARDRTLALLRMFALSRQEPFLLTKEHAAPHLLSGTKETMVLSEMNSVRNTKQVEEFHPLTQMTRRGGSGESATSIKKRQSRKWLHAKRTWVFGTLAMLLFTMVSMLVFGMPLLTVMMDIKSWYMKPERGHRSRIQRKTGSKHARSSFAKKDSQLSTEKNRPFDRMMHKSRMTDASTAPSNRHPFLGIWFNFMEDTQ